MNKRGVYFFVVDAFIGGAIIMVSLMVILNSYTSTPDKIQPIVILEDFVAYLQTTEVRDFQGNLTQNLVVDGNISDFRNTLFEQIADFHARSEVIIVNSFISELVNLSLPSQISLAYYYNDDLLYERENFLRINAEQVLSSKKISVVTVNRTDIYGPHLVEVVLWTA